MSLCSFRIDPVVADVVSFFDDDDAVKFTLSSPKGYAIVEYFRAVTRKISTLSIDLIGDAIEIKYSDEIMQRTVHCERGEINKLVKFLSTCQAIDTIIWKKLIVNDDIIKELLHIRIGNMYMKSNRFDVNPRLAVKFLQKNVNTIGTESVEISNTLINDNNMKLFKNVDFHFSLNREKQSFENRVTNISDEYLRFNWENGIEKFELTGFLTGFTVKGIAEYAEKTKPYSDFGIISCDQLEEAVAYINDRDVDTILFGWNGQKMLSFGLYSTRDNDKLAVILTENGQDISKILTARFIARNLEMFNEIIEVVNATCDEEKIESEQRVINEYCEFTISYDKDYKESTRLSITIYDDSLDQYFEVNRTDIDEGEAHLIVHKFLKMYCLTGEVTWSGLEMTKDDVRLLQMASSFEIDVASLQWLTDDWLTNLFNKQTFPKSLLISNNFFSALGINKCLQLLENKNEELFDYHLGRIRDKNVEEVKKMVREIMANTEGPWQVNIHGYGYTNTEEVVTIKKKTNDEHSGVTIEFQWPKDTMKDDDEMVEPSDSSDDFDEEESSSISSEMDEDEAEEDSEIDEDNVN